MKIRRTAIFGVVLIALSQALSISGASAQSGSATKPMQDTQRKAEQKARASKQPSHHKQSHQNPGGAAPASSPGASS